MNRLYLINLGCTENVLDGNLITDYFIQNGWEVIDNVENADLIIVNSCGFSKISEDFSMNAYRRIVANKRPDSRLIFAGCLPAINRKLIRSEGYDDIFVTPRSLHQFDKIINPE